ncbi:MAG: YidC/Oxa1 family membrane protein insertase [Dysgonamonadaceae bacterium]|nr:YidC/Oxa1 family membrane protein insertase [Dysgonamonadaceae bacterium]
MAQKLFKETGVSIMCVSGAISVLCLPLYMVAENWQEVERKIQKRLAPKITKIKAVFKGDEQYMILSTYYRQNHYHPVYAMRSTFGLLIQIPFFIAAYSYLAHLDALQGSRFLFIRDLGKPDALLLIGRGVVSLNILPILMTLINCTSGAVYTRGLAIKDKVQVYGMSLIFLVLLYNSSAGLVLYWTLNNVFSLVKNLYIKIPYSGKDKIVRMGVSLVCGLMIFYVLAVYRGRMDVRLLFSIFSVLIVLAVWTFPLLKKSILRLSGIPYIPKQTFLLFIMSFSIIWILLGLTIPTTLIVSSPQEFSFIDNYTSPLFFIGNTFLQVSGFFLFWPFCLYCLFSPVIKKSFAFLGMLLCIVMVCNVFLFPGNYGLISINLVFSGSVSHSAKEISFNLLILCAIVFMATLLYVSKRRGIITSIFGLCIFALAGISCVNMYKIQREYTHTASYLKNQDTRLQVSVEPIFRLSKTGKNVVVIMLDRAISVFVPYILEESPELRKEYSGFVYYPNTVSFNGYTAIGSPPIFGGYEYTPKEINKRDTVPLIDKHNQALLMLPRIFSEDGFTVTVTDPPYANYNNKSDISIYDPYPEVKAYITDSVYTDLWLKEHDMYLPSISDVLKRNIFYYCLFRGLPLAFRQAIYTFGDWCAPLKGHSLRLTLNGYAVLEYLPQLTMIDEEEKGALLLLTNNTTHEGSFLQASEFRPKLYITDYGTSKFKNEVEYHINIASLKRLADWFAFLKNEGIYDNTKIILVSDHGPESNFVTKIGLPFNVDQFNPLLMIKEFNASGDIETDMTFMSNADVPTIALKNVIDNAINPFTGNAITMESKKSPLYIAISGSIHLEGRRTTQFTLNPKRDYYVHDNIFKPESWSATSK